MPLNPHEVIPIPTPPEHELPEVLAFWEDFDGLINDVEQDYVNIDWDPFLGRISDLITTLAYRKALRR